MKAYQILKCWIDIYIINERFKKETQWGMGERIQNDTHERNDQPILAPRALVDIPAAFFRPNIFKAQVTDASFFTNNVDDRIAEIIMVVQTGTCYPPCCHMSMPDHFRSKFSTTNGWWRYSCKRNEAKKILTLQRQKRQRIILVRDDVRPFVSEWWNILVTMKTAFLF